MSPAPVSPATSFAVTLPYPPSVNGMYRGNRTGGVYMKGATRKWYEKALAAVKRVPGYRKGLFPEGVRVRVTIKVVPPTRRKYDIDNRIKAVYDVLQKAGVFDDDNQVYEGVEYKYDKDETGQLPRGAAFVTVEALPPGTGVTIWANGS